MKKVFLILIVTVLLFSSCTNGNTKLDNSATEQITAEPTLIATPVPTDTPEPTPSPTAVPTEPKYIFIVIGDGFGRGAMMMGEIYARLESEDMQIGAAWENFTHQSWVDGRGESASGGTAIATGYVSPPSFISQTTEYQDLYTIMDRAKEAGMSTGVVTNSHLLDATPATFLSHDDWRLNAKKLSQRIADSNVDYIAGGGLQNLVPQSYYSSFNSIDCRNKVVKSTASELSAFPQLIEQGYTPYLGMTGAQSFLEQVAAGTFSDEKAICVFSETVMAYETSKLDSGDVEKYRYVPSLSEMTEGGIQALSQNPNGFIMMIEEGSIDKRAHNGSQSGIISQVESLRRTMSTIMDFYNEHPYETLVILTADHETGNFKFNEDKFLEFKTWPNFTWTSEADQMIDFLDNTWGVEVYGSKITKYISYDTESPWDTVEENRANLYNYVTLQTSLELGIEPKTEDHSWQLVPCYTTGVASGEFSKAAGIQDIPIIICEIMGWEALPEVIEE